MNPIDFDIYWEDIPAVRVRFDAQGNPFFEALDKQHLPALLYGVNGTSQPDEKRLDRFLADRCFPSTRQNARELLDVLGLALYQPKLICRKTHGLVAHDRFWLRYADDPDDLSYGQLLAQMGQAARLG